MNIEIPKYDHTKGEYEDQAPCWISVTAYGTGKKVKPQIVCKCGEITGIGLHHVHADGKVTASFFHKNKGGAHTNDNQGCQWHVFLQLKNYSDGEFKPKNK